MTGVYLAYPIDQSASMVHMLQQAEAFKRLLISTGVANWVFDPGDAFATQPPALLDADPRVRQINQMAARKADVIAAFLPRGVPTVGVPMEIDRGIQEGKYVIVFSDAESYMLSYRSVQRFPGWEDDHLHQAVGMIRDLSPVERTPEPLPVKMLSDLGYLPTRSHVDDAGLDLHVAQNTIIEPKAFVDVPCAIAFELPPWAWALIIGRSSTFRKRGLLVYPGIVDTGYRGPIFAGVWNAGDEAVTVARGERVAQLIIHSNQTQHIAPIQVDQLTESSRGTNGFGSSGA